MSNLYKWGIWLLGKCQSLPRKETTISTSTGINLLPWAFPSLSSHTSLSLSLHQEIVVGPHEGAGKLQSGQKNPSNFHPTNGSFLGQWTQQVATWVWNIWPRTAFLKPSLLLKSTHNISFHLHPALHSEKKSNQSRGTETSSSHHESAGAQRLKMHQGTSHPAQMSKVTRFQ